jgi:DHA2 family multidrug resistance protein
MATPKGFAKAIIIITTVSAAVMELIDTSIINVALTDMSGSLGVNIEDISWVITSYAIANVIIIPLTGFLAAYFGRKNYYLASMIIFTIASYLCGQSSSLLEIVIWRFVQGVGGGALLSTSQSILFDAFEPKDRGKAAGLFGMGLILGPTLGPTLGGYIMQHFSWPLIFLINIPIGIIATVLSYIFIEKQENEGKNKSNIHIDYLGIGLLAAFISCLQFVLERGQSEDWFNSESIRICSLIATVSFIVFVWHELRIKNPAVNIRLLGNSNLAFTSIFTFIAGIGLFTSVFVYPILAQRVLGFTAYETGLTLLAPTIAGVIAMPIMGILMSKGISPVPFVTIGFILFTCYAFMNAGISPDIGRNDLFFPFILRALGIAMCQLPLINQAVAGLHPKDYATGIGINNMIRQLGGASGIAIANNYIAQRYAQHRIDLVSNMQNGQMQANAIAQNIIAKTGDVASVANTKALTLINSTVERQSYFLSYLDTLRLIGIFFIIALPLVLFLRTKKKTAAEIEASLKAASESH